jgi:glycosyltransferase involved in cell wall biosynthesis
VNAYSAVMVKGETVIAVSNTVRDYIIANYPDLGLERIEVIYRGVEPSEFPHGYRPSAAWLEKWRADYPQLIGQKVLLLPGRITRLKGHESFIRLVATLKAEGLPVHGLIVGGAQANKQTYLAELHAQIVAAKLEANITFTGDRSDLRDIMAVSDLVLSLSTQPESFGRTVLEALSLGIPVVGYNHGGVGEILTRIYPQGLTPLGDADLLADLVRTRLIKPVMPAEAHPFTLQHMLDATLSVYANLSRHS